MGRVGWLLSHARRMDCRPRRTSETGIRVISSVARVMIVGLCDVASLLSPFHLKKKGMPDRARFSVARELAGMEPAQAFEVSTKFAQLDERLCREYGRRVRDDSRLAFHACTGSIQRPVEEIIAEMATMQWISENTDYQAFCEVSLRKMADRAKATYGIRNWKPVWEVVRYYGPDLVKLHMVKEIGEVPELRVCAD